MTGNYKKTIALTTGALALCVALSVATSLFSTKHQEISTETNPETSLKTSQETSLKTSSETSLDQRVNELLATMSIEEKIGQVLLINFRTWGVDEQNKSIPLETCNDTMREIIQKYHLGNIILFGENVENTELAVKLVEDLQSASLAGGGLPLLIGIDQEGGVVTRLGQGTCLPGNMAIGASGKTENARLAGEIIGEELAAIGVNCNFAPVCDVNDNPQNPVIHLRSFSADPQVVSDMARAMWQGISSRGISSAVKHFPGHGNTATDSHFGLPVVDKSKADWEAVEAVPFRTAIQDGVDMVMSAHIQYPQLDDTKYRSQLTGETLYLPATLSHKILTDILRGEMGFEGVVVTDAMNMQAIKDNFGETESCVMALAAGADMLCNPTAITRDAGMENLDRLYTDIKSALNDGRLSPERLDEAAGRVLRLKLERGIIDGEPDTRTLEQKVQNAQSVVGSPAHRETERKLANDAITLYSDAPYAPIKPAAGDTVLFLVPYENKGYSVTYAINRLTAEGKIPTIETKIALYEEQTTVSATLIEQINSADYVVIVSQMSAGDLNAPENWQVKMPQQLLDASKAAGKVDRSAVVSAGLPNDALHFADVPVYLAYSYQGMSAEDAESGVLTQKYGPNLPAAIDCLMGVFEPQGTLPVHLK